MPGLRRISIAAVRFPRLRGDRPSYHERSGLHRSGRFPRLRGDRPVTAEDDLSDIPKTWFPRLRGDRPH